MHGFNHVSGEFDDVAIDIFDRAGLSGQSRMAYCYDFSDCHTDILDQPVRPGNSFLSEDQITADGGGGSSAAPAFFNGTAIR